MGVKCMHPYAPTRRVHGELWGAYCRECDHTVLYAEGELRVIGPLEKMMEAMKTAALKTQTLYMSSHVYESLLSDPEFTKE